MKIFRFFFLTLVFVGLALRAEDNYTKPDKYVTKPYVLPFVRPIGFTYNVGAIASMTFEGRFLLGLAPNISLVISPMFQNTPEFPFWLNQEDDPSYFDVRRVNLGAGIRGNFYGYDSRSGWYIEGLGRGGLAWVGKDNYVWSVIPSVMAGYAVVYDSGYTVSMGLGVEWEFLLGDEKTMGEKTKKLKSAFLGMTKYPLIAELSIGWIW